MNFQPSALSFRNPSIWERKPTIVARKKGAAGTYAKEDVIELQRALNIANRPTVPLVLDGDFVEKLASGKDSATMIQVKLFQSMNDLTPNGIVDADFWTVLAKKVGAALPTTPATTTGDTKKKFDWNLAVDAANFVGQYVAKPSLDRAASAQSLISAQQAAQLAALQQQQQQQQKQQDDTKDNTLWWILGGVGGLVVIGGIGLTIWAVTRKN